jgi:hypothetical protein
MKKTIITLLPVITALTLTGCWTPPNANVQPKGEPRLIQSGIPVESQKKSATVESVDASQRVVNLKLADGTTTTCKVGPQVTDFGQLRSGDKVKVTLAEKLTVYVLKDGRLPVAGGKDETIYSNAKVQSVDPSYRLLTLQYLNGQTEVFKVGLDAKVLEMQPGDDVVLHITEIKAVDIERSSVWFPTNVN